LVDVDRYASDGNIALFVDQIQWESDPARRERLKRLLIEEVNRFGASEERLGMVERHIKRGEAIIARQAHLVASLKSKGDDASAAEACLRAFQAIHDLLLNLRVHTAGEGRATSARTSFCNGSGSNNSLTFSE